MIYKIQNIITHSCQLNSQVVLLRKQADAFRLVVFAQLSFFLEFLSNVLDLLVFSFELVLSLDGVEEGFDAGVQLPPVPVAELNELPDVALDAFGSTAVIKE